MLQAALQPRSWFAGLVPRLTAASGVGYLAIAYTVSRWLTRRSPAQLTAPARCDDLAFEDVECVTSDRVRLRGWIFSPPAPRATIALFHGLRGNRGHLFDRVVFLTRAGYRCVVFDHRAHGESAGRRTSFGYHEARDVEAVADHVCRRWPAQPRFALGISMGAAALCLAGSAAAQAFDALVLESVYDRLASAFQHRVGVQFPDWFRHFRRGIIWITERRLGVRIDAVAPVAHVHLLAPRPVLLLTGSEDPHAPPHEVRQLYENYDGPRTFHIIDGAGHDDVHRVGGEAYRRLVLEFFERNLDPSSAPSLSLHTTK